MKTSVNKMDDKIKHHKKCCFKQKCYELVRVTKIKKNDYNAGIEVKKLNYTRKINFIQMDDLREFVAMTANRKRPSSTFSQPEIRP